MNLEEATVWATPEYVDVGMKVVVPYQRAGLWCVVVCAAGTHARVTNEKRDFSAWFRLDEMRIPAQQETPP